MINNTELQHAQKMLQAWLDAEYAAATGNKSYMIDGRSITRYSLTEIKERQDYWRARCNQLRQGMPSPTRIGRGIVWRR